MKAKRPEDGISVHYVDIGITLVLLDGRYYLVNERDVKAMVKWAKSDNCIVNVMMPFGSRVECFNLDKCRNDNLRVGQ